MLNIYFGLWDINDKNYISQLNSYFDYEYEDNWITNDISKQIIKDIDDSDVIGNKIIESPILGSISPERLSGGTKLLITMLMNKENVIYNGTNCGENCSDWILKIAENKDIYMNRCYLIKFTQDKFRIRILNDNSIVTNNKELLNKFIEYYELTKI